MPPEDPLAKKDWPPLPEKPPPFDLDALRGIPVRNESKRRWWRRRSRKTGDAEPAPKVTTARTSAALLALIPAPEQCLAVREALSAAGASYAVPPRLVLRNGLSLQDQVAWRDAVQTVTSTWRPFTVRLRPPQVIDERMVCLEPVGDAVSDLQRAVVNALALAGFLPRTGDVSEPVLLLAGTFTGFSRVELHELANSVCDQVRFPMDFRASTVYAVAEAAADDDMPVDAFPLTGSVAGAS
jgi:hypothetical protein